MMTEHPYAQVLRWIADGEEIEILEDGVWSWCGFGNALRLIATKANSPEDFRLVPPKPRTHWINGIECPEPETKAPEMNARYWTPALAEDGLYRELEWMADTYDFRMLERGLVHRTEEAAVANAKAMLCSRTTSAEATDKELLAFAEEEEFMLFCDGDDFLQIARAVLHKFGRGNVC